LINLFFPYNPLCLQQHKPRKGDTVRIKMDFYVGISVNFKSVPLRMYDC